MTLMSNDRTSNDLSFYALASGPVPSPFAEDDGAANPVPLSVVDLGVLRVPSGRVEACDPFVTLGDGPVFEVEPGDYPVRVTVADVEAYLSLVLADGEPASVEAAQPVRGRGIVCVDAGAVAFVDHDAVATAMPPQDDWYDVFDSGEPDSWFSLMDSPDHYRRGAANIVMPRAGAGENVVLSYSGWGDGVYPVMLTRDADGAPLGLHIDLGVVGGFASEDEEDDEDE